MANSLIRSGNVTPPDAKFGAVETQPDNRVWLYKGQEARLFASKEAVPEGEDWREAPYEIEATEADQPKKKKQKKAETDDANAPASDEPVTDGDGN